MPKNSEKLEPLALPISSGLLADSVSWFWHELARAGDRRGDPDLLSGTVVVQLPESPAERNAVAGLLQGRGPNLPGSRRKVRLEELAEVVSRHCPGMTPGAVAAQVLQRPLAEKKLAQRALEVRKIALANNFAAHIHGSPAAYGLLGDPQRVWKRLQQSGQVAKMLSASEQFPGGVDGLLGMLVRILVQLPVAGSILTGEPNEHIPVPLNPTLDRRLLASASTGDPHALDEGTVLGGLILSLLTAGETIPAGLRPRAAWARVGVSCDELVGGLMMLGIHPEEWIIPNDAVITVPPRHLADVRWPAAPPGGAWVFVTENPSVIAAAAKMPSSGIVRLICTNGTPSAIEVAAVSALEAEGWHVAVRADFDTAGIRHVNTILAAAENACPWRMSAKDYLEVLDSLQTVDALGLGQEVPEPSWDVQLGTSMQERGTPVFEESLLPLLLQDLRRGTPPSSPNP